MTTTYKTVISRYAEDDLIEILDYYSSINAEYSLKLMGTLEKRVSELKKYPERGRIVPELEKQNIVEYREIIEGNYRIIFSIQDNTVIIHTVIDGRRNLEELLMNKLMRFYS